MGGGGHKNQPLILTNIFNYLIIDKRYFFNLKKGGAVNG